MAGLTVGFLSLLPYALSQTASQSRAALEEQIWQHRNLGKAFYENPTTFAQAVDEFKIALDLAPDSVRERINYGIALLRAGKTEEGMAELRTAQEQDPSVPHTWFNLGIEYKRESEYERAIEQLAQMARLVPDEAVTHYNLGYLYKLTGNDEQSLEHLERSAQLDPNLAGPRFQLYNTYRAMGRGEDAARELRAFQEIRARQAGAAVPEDLDWSYYAEIYETIDLRSAPETAAELKFETQVINADLGGAAVGLTLFDANADGAPDLLVWSAERARLLLGGSSIAEDSGLEQIRGVIGAAPGDFNNDGRDDLCVITAGGAALYANENGKFTRQATQLPEGDFRKAVWLDYDHDYDVDLFLLGANSKLLRNEGNSDFGDRTATFPFATGTAVDGVVIDLVPDANGWDLAVAYAGGPGKLYRDQLGGRYEAVDLAALPAGARYLMARDFNNDGKTDLAASSSGKVVLLTNDGKGFAASATDAAAPDRFDFADVENRGYADLIAGGSILRNGGMGRFTSGTVIAQDAKFSTAADFDQDGRIDLAAVLADGSLQLLKNQTETSNHWLGVALTGVKNLQLAAEAEVEIKTGQLYQKQVYRGLPLHFGLGTYQTADAVRITWPNALIQNEVRQEGNRKAEYKEAPRLSGSCPMIFTWNGKEFEFITDVLGVAPLGATAGDGIYFPVDHDEYIQIAGRSLAPVDGQYEIRITEELREVAFLDQIQLIAVDHPAEVDLFTNDKFKAPPFPEFRLFGVEERIHPKAARDKEGRDVLAKLVRKDSQYPDGYRRDYAGVAELHHLDLDFGDAAQDNRAVLVLSGWVDWADGSVFLGASQQKGGGLVMPYLQVKNKAGQWQTVFEDMGIPAGKPKTIVVDLTGKFLSDSREIRIVTNLCVYWDEIFLSEDIAEPQVRLTEVNAASAEFRYRGFSLPVIHAERKQPERFDYQTWMPVSMWNPTPGMYTRYGTVNPLIEEADDRFVIMGSGDELRLLFPENKMPPLAQGWTRDFLLLVDGWAKDQDANTAYSQTVEPLPFHDMTVYPYPAEEKFPAGETHRSYQAEYNTRPALRLLRPVNERQWEARSRP
ncbi:MAG: hypothetical protein A3F68_09920 [Acidobacteria bacterium RIFCSPLOWO2_12_FULL_54_10]|nr:MAG: hypothetical protein A3F68_09920 [Acidobacteria bacterium RIFCSPLOWO2_12_FULL_54_10]